jgi:aminomethyltransferase
MPSPSATPELSVSAAPAKAAEQFRTMVSGCGVARLSWRARLAITGSDSVRWLNGMTTNNVRDLAPGQGVYAFILNPQGHIQGDGYVFNRGEALIFETDASQAASLKAIFDHYIIMDDVEVNDLPPDAIEVIGPKAQASLEAAGLQVPDLGSLQFAELNWQGAALTVVRRDQPVIPAYEVWGEAQQVGALWQALQSSGAVLLDENAVELVRMASGLPKYGQDIRERDLPQETEQARALNFNKGCYIGQEIVERIRSRGSVHRKFTGFEVEGPLPPPGTKIQADGKDVGEVTSSAALPLHHGVLPAALGYVRREHSVPGKCLQAGDSVLTVTDLPFRKVFEE